jgi:ion channel-forming bestrophin family protein
VLWHAIFTASVVVLDKYAFESVGLPSTIIPSLSIVVGLMLVFRNQTSYNRFWDGRNALQTINTSIRNLVRMITTNAYNSSAGPPTETQRQDIERTIKFLMAIPYAVKNHLRSEWGAAWLWNGENGGDMTRSQTEAGTPGFFGSTSEIRMPRGTEVYGGTNDSNGNGNGNDNSNDNSNSNKKKIVDNRYASRLELDDDTTSIYNPVYASLLPAGLEGHESDGLGLPFELTFFVDGFIKRGVDRGWFHPPGASQMQAQLNTLTDAFGKMETIMITPIPVGHLYVQTIFSLSLSFFFFLPH